jgi:hypothetical protein
MNISDSQQYSERKHNGLGLSLLQLTQSFRLFELLSLKHLAVMSVTFLGVVHPN